MIRFSELNAMKQDQRNKKAEQLRLAARIIETGCGWEIERVGMGCLDSGHINNAQWGCPLDAINHGFPIRIKEWKLPDPPAGRKWHREGWTQEMLPDGWRPLLDGEVVQSEDEYQQDDSWITSGKVTSGSVMIFKNDWRHRTRRPLPEPIIPVPEGWRELPDSEKDGRWIEGAKWLNDRGEWIFSYARDGGASASDRQRIIVPVAKPKKRVPLGPGDIVPGSVIRAYSFADGVFSMIVHQNCLGINIVNQNKDVEFIGWEWLMEQGWQIKRFGHTEWQPCYKEVES